MKSKLALAAALFTLSSPAYAQTYCGGQGPVLRLLTYRDGGVIVRTAWRGDFIMICNLEKQWKEVSPGTCFAWMSKIASAIAANENVGFWYETSQPNFCATMPTYGGSPTPVYIDVFK